MSETDEPFALLTRWGDLGHGVSLYYGVSHRDEGPAVGWVCMIQRWMQDSGPIVFSSYEPPAAGFHPTDPVEAARIALQQAGERWPEIAGKIL